MKWGTAYGAEYVNILLSMVSRNTSRPVRLVCFTDDPTDLDPQIEAQPLPAIDMPERYATTGWRKISLLQADVGGLSGDFLFLDLDVVITSSIDDFFDFQPSATFCVIENWTQRGLGIGNTSVYRLKVGAHTEVFDAYMADPVGTIEGFRNEQTFKSRTISSMVYWPEPWCASFKHSLLPPFPLNFVRTASLPADAKVVCFTGRPNPDHARDGIWPEKKWYKRLRKKVRPTPWIAEHWR